MNGDADRASRRGEDVGGVIVFGPRTAPDALGGTAGGTPTDASEKLVEVVDPCGSPQDLCDAEGACYTMKERGLRDACAQQPRVNEDCGGGPAEADYGAARSSPGACRCVLRYQDDCRCRRRYQDDGGNGDDQDDDEESGGARRGAFGGFGGSQGFVSKNGGGMRRVVDWHAGPMVRGQEGAGGGITESRIGLGGSSSSNVSQRRVAAIAALVSGLEDVNQRQRRAYWSTSARCGRRRCKDIGSRRLKAQRS